MINASPAYNVSDSVIESNHSQSAAAIARVTERFKYVFNTLDHQHAQTDLLETLYHDDMVFEDAFHQFKSLADFKSYCASLYENLVYSEFDFQDQWIDEGSAMLTWTMRLQHNKLNGGQEISVDGASQIRFDQYKITYHKDYFDGGALLYEHVPILGRFIKLLKRRLN